MVIVLQFWVHFHLSTEPQPRTVGVVLVLVSMPTTGPDSVLEQFVAKL